LNQDQSLFIVNKEFKNLHWIYLSNENAVRPLSINNQSLVLKKFPKHPPCEMLKNKALNVDFEYVNEEEWKFLNYVYGPELELKWSFKWD